MHVRIWQAPTSARASVVRMAGEFNHLHQHTTSCPKERVNIHVICVCKASGRPHYHTSVSRMFGFRYMFGII